LQPRPSIGSFSSKVRVALAISLIASVAISGLIYFSQTRDIEHLRLELADKSTILSAQSQQLSNYHSDIENQQRQIEEKSSELVSLQSEIDNLRNKVALSDLQIKAKTAEAENLADTISAQQGKIQAGEQAEKLEDEIKNLEVQLQEKQSQISILTGNVRDTQAKLDGLKRLSIKHYSVAVTQEHVGIVLPVQVDIIPDGEGVVSIDVKNVQYETGFQEAVRKAVKVASDYTDVSVSDKDIIITVVNDNNNRLITIDGGSAGALITAMIASVLSGEEMNSSVLITGSINSDGTVGNIGGLSEKADAAAEFGADTLLVPEDQAFRHDSIRIVGVSDIGDIMRQLTS